MRNENRQIQEIKLTEEMLLNIMRGKDLHLFFHKEGQEFEFRFRGPYNGMFLTHEEIANLQYSAEARMADIFHTMQNMPVVNIARYKVGSSEGISIQTKNPVEKDIAPDPCEEEELGDDEEDTKIPNHWRDHDEG